MRVLINIHGEKAVSPQLQVKIEEMLRDRLERFGDLLTRLELYIGRNEGVHAGMDIYRYGVEARAAGKPPIKVHHGARRPDLVAEGAAVKLITVTERRVAQKRTVSRRGHAP